MKKLKKHNFKKIFVARVVFHKTKNMSSLRFAITMNHFTTMVGNVANILFVRFLHKNHYNLTLKEYQNIIWYLRIWNQNGKQIFHSKMKWLGGWKFVMYIVKYIIKYVKIKSWTHLNINVWRRMMNILFFREFKYERVEKHNFSRILNRK